MTPRPFKGRTTRPRSDNTTGNRREDLIRIATELDIRTTPEGYTGGNMAISLLSINQQAKIEVPVLQFSDKLIGGSLLLFLLNYMKDESDIDILTWFLSLFFNYLNSPTSLIDSIATEIGYKTKYITITLTPIDGIFDSSEIELINSFSEENPKIIEEANVVMNKKLQDPAIDFCNFLLFIIAEAKSSNSDDFYIKYMDNRVKVFSNLIGNDQLKYCKFVFQQKIRKILSSGVKYRKVILSLLTNYKTNDDKRFSKSASITVDTYLAGTDLTAFILVYNFLLLPRSSILSSNYLAENIRKISYAKDGTKSTSTSEIFFSGYIRSNLAVYLSWSALAPLSNIAKSVGTATNEMLKKIGGGVEQKMMPKEDFDRLVKIATEEYVGSAQDGGVSLPLDIEDDVDDVGS